MYTVLCIGVIHPPIISQHAHPPAISVLRSELHAIYSIVMSPYVFGCIRLCSAWNEDRYKYVMTGTFGSYLTRLTTNWARLRWPFGAAGGEETESVVAQLARWYSIYISGELGWKISEETCNRSTINTCSRCSREVAIKVAIIIFYFTVAYNYPVENSFWKKCQNSVNVNFYLEHLQQIFFIAGQTPGSDNGAYLFCRWGAGEVQVRCGVGSTSTDCIRPPGYAPLEGVEVSRGVYLRKPKCWFAHS